MPAPTGQSAPGTLYHNLGIDVNAATLPDLTGRPQYLAEDQWNRCRSWFKRRPREPSGAWNAVGPARLAGPPHRFDVQKIRLFVFLLVVALGAASLGAWYVSRPTTAPPPKCPAPGPPAADPLESRFTTKIHPFLENYCYPCHGPDRQEAALDFSSYATVTAVVNDGAAGTWCVRGSRRKRCRPKRPAPAGRR